mmetsp:Transcript_2643/g.4269  ORF Transcript_2643/g.4269 Transcript_2643/m.4269 type:complete len:201 (-) Transcript_2643:950-1552(-)
MSSAIAGLAAIPGESIEAALMNPGTPAKGPMTQSPVVFFARTPANVWIVLPALKLGTSLRHFIRMYAMMSSVFSSRTAWSTTYSPLASSFFSVSRAVGPRIRLPQSVVCTITPLPYTGCGAGKRTWRDFGPSALLSKMYSPMRGFTLNDVSPTIAAILSETHPPALMTWRARYTSRTAGPPITVPGLGLHATPPAASMAA